VAIHKHIIGIHRHNKDTDLNFLIKFDHSSIRP